MRSKPKAFDDLLPESSSRGSSGNGAGKNARRVQRRDTAEDDSSMSMAGHPEGPYGDGSHTFGRYNNFANAAHMLCRLVRRTSGNPHAIDWQMNLRGGVGRKPEDGWRRYFSRKQASFDAIQRICNPNDEAYQSQLGTPVDNTFDRHKGAIKCSTIRDLPISFERAKGCEGAQAGQWQHIFREKPAATRLQLQHLTTLREMPGQDEGIRISDNRSDACWVEMMGKKRWENCRPRNPLERHPQEGGDPKMHHNYWLKVKPEPDEDARNVRKTKTPRLSAEEKSRRTVG